MCERICRANHRSFHVRKNQYKIKISVALFFSLSSFGVMLLLLLLGVVLLLCFGPPLFISIRRIACGYYRAIEHSNSQNDVHCMYTLIHTHKQPLPKLIGYSCLHFLIHWSRFVIFHIVYLLEYFSVWWNRWYELNALPKTKFDCEKA